MEMILTLINLAGICAIVYCGYRVKKEFDDR